MALVIGNRNCTGRAALLPVQVLAVNPQNAAAQRGLASLPSDVMPRSPLPLRRNDKGQELCTFNLIELSDDQIRNLDDYLPRLLLKFGVTVQ